MSDNNINVNIAQSAQNNPSFLKEMGTSVAFSGAITGFGGLTSAVRYGGVSEALKATNKQGFVKLNSNLQSAGKDVFTRGIELSQNYDSYKSIAKNAKKLEKAATKVAKNGGKLTWWQSVKNHLPFTTKIDASKIGKNAQDAATKLKDAQKAIVKGEDIIETGTKLAGKSGADTAKSLFKSELKNKFVLGITILSALPRIKEEIIPAFKEKGFIEGMKATGKVIARTATDFVSNAGFSAVGRAIGSAIGTFICPGAGSAVGGTFGDVIGSFFSMKLIDKIFTKKKKEEQAPTQDEISQNQNQINNAELIPMTGNEQEIAQNQVQAEVQNETQEQSNQNQAPIVVEDFKTAKAKYDTDSAKVENPIKRKSGYIKPVNGVYKTEWVNEMNKDKQRKTDLIG